MARRRSGGRKAREGPRRGHKVERNHRMGGRGAGLKARPMKGKAMGIGLDGHLRVVLEPIDIRVAGRLRGPGGAEVIQQRGQLVGRVVGLVGSLQAPVAIVELDEDAREGAAALLDREVFIG